jgi:glutamate racemase
VIGVLGTDATVRQAYVDRLVAKFAPDCVILRHGSAALVDYAEAQLRGEPVAPACYRAVLDGLLTQPDGGRMDTVVLACTHFPLVQAELEAGSPRPLAFVDGKEGIARRTAWLTRDVIWPDTPGEGVALFTRWTERLESYRAGLAAYGLSRMERL